MEEIKQIYKQLKIELGLIKYSQKLRELYIILNGSDGHDRPRDYFLFIPIGNETITYSIEQIEEKLFIHFCIDTNRKIKEFLDFMRTKK